MSEPRYTAVLCDVDGVVRHWSDSMSGVDSAHGFPTGTLASTAFDPVRLYPAITGAIADEEWRASIADALAQQCGSLDAAQAAVTTWSELIGAVDQDVVELLGKVRAWAPVVLVSNATTRLESDLAHLGLFDAVDGVVSSARVGVAKPEPAIYLAAARSVGAEPGLCLFIDDTLGHVEGARAVGMTAVHYTGMESLRDVVR